MATGTAAVLCVSILLVVMVKLQVTSGQGEIGSEFPCGVDNLSCPPVNMLPNTTAPVCYGFGELCNGIQFCSNGNDEGFDNVALECKFNLK